MKIKFTIFSILLLTILNHSCNNKTQVEVKKETTNFVEPKFTATLELLGIANVGLEDITYRERIYDQKLNCPQLLVKLKITNHNDTTFHFTYMRCSWNRQVKISPKICKIYWACDGNYAILLPMKPLESIEFYARLPYNKFLLELQQIDSFKMGFDIITESDFDLRDKEVHKYGEGLTQNQLDSIPFIWSNYVSISKSLSKIPNNSQYNNCLRYNWYWVNSKDSILHKS